ncbi:MAG: hypothetical protein AAF438_13075, partial [Pseudomonadota bacterium]
MFLESAEPLSIQLKGPITKVVRSKYKEIQHPFELTVDGETIAVMVNARGNSRKKLCKFPPIKISFSDDTQGSTFSGVPSLRLVTHCGSPKSGNDKVVLEYLAYRIHTVLSDVSYRPRLLDITYTDTSKPKKHKTYQGFGLVTESEHQMAERVGGKLLDQTQVRRGELNQHSAGLVNLFHYLIGNTDWSLVAPFNEDKCCHNGQLLTINQQTYIAPYDFDLSGLVKARYAKPNPELPINRVTTRYYQGVCIKNQDPPVISSWAWEIPSKTCSSPPSRPTSISSTPSPS